MQVSKKMQEQRVTQDDIIVKSTSYHLMTIYLFIIILSFYVSVFEQKVLVLSK